MKSLSETRKLVSVRILNDVFNKSIVEAIDETCSKDIVVHNPHLPSDLKGIDAFKKFLTDFLRAFEDIHLHIDNLHAEDDMVDCHATFTAINVESFLGSPATQKKVSTEPVFFFKFGTDGKVSEHWQERIP